jgi:hypothetical protein
MRLLAILAVFAALPASAASFSFTGSFGAQDDVQLFSFTLGSNSTVTLTTLSYGGGVNAAGATISPGGFDPVLSVFDSTGALLTSSDDGNPPDINTDPVTGEAYDVYFQTLLSPGTYQLALTHFNGFAIGPNLSDGFDPITIGGCPNGVFCDSKANNRTSAWALDILNVDQASAIAAPIPEPSSIFLLGAGLLLAAGGLRKRRAA